jgi:tRNA threonylcarbamoyladenosine biosynthesis protein TsaB
MAFLLHIDTSGASASICLSDQEQVIDTIFNNEQADHAAWLQTGIRDILEQQGGQLKELEAVSVSIGPGSYTGLRVGLSSAKGLCYALGIPLIAINTLEMIAHSVKDEAIDLICPVIDARRMEVFTAIYDKQLHLINEPSAIVIDMYAFTNLLSNRNLIFAGSGVEKMQSVITHANAKFSTKLATATDLAALAFQHFKHQQFADVAYTEPFYLKEFLTSYKPLR